MRRRAKANTRAARDADRTTASREDLAHSITHHSALIEVEWERLSAGQSTASEDHLLELIERKRRLVEIWIKTLKAMPQVSTHEDAGAVAKTPRTVERGWLSNPAVRHQILDVFHTALGLDDRRESRNSTSAPPRRPRELGPRDPSSSSG